MLIAIIVMGLLFSPSPQTSSCDGSAFQRLMAASPRARYEYRGRYVNWSYEYSVVIPQGLTGYDGRDEANHTGFGLALGKPPERFLFVKGEHNSAEYKTPREAATQLAEDLRQEGKSVESVTISKSHLGTLKAVLLVVTYTCVGSADRHVLSSTMALSADRSLLYTVDVYSYTDRYESDRPIQDQITKSWRMTPKVRRHQRR